MGTSSIAYNVHRSSFSTPIECHHERTHTQQKGDDGIHGSGALSEVDSRTCERKVRLASFGERKAVHNADNENSA